MEGYYKGCIKEIGWDGLVWNRSGRDKYCAVVNTVMNFEHIHPVVFS
jgi:hypothetical protein